MTDFLDSMIVSNDNSSVAEATSKNRRKMTQGRQTLKLLLRSVIKDYMEVSLHGYTGFSGAF